MGYTQGHYIKLEMNKIIAIHHNMDKSHKYAEEKKADRKRVHSTESIR